MNLTHEQAIEKIMKDRAIYGVGFMEVVLDEKGEIAYREIPVRRESFFAKVKRIIKSIFQ